MKILACFALLLCIGCSEQKPVPMFQVTDSLIWDGFGDDYLDHAPTQYEIEVFIRSLSDAELKQLREWIIEELDKIEWKDKA